MKLLIVLSVCLLVNAVRSEDTQAEKDEIAELAKLDQELAALTPDEKEAKEDFLLGLVHHAVHGVLGAGHGVLNLAGHIIGDEELKAKLDQTLVLKPEDFELVEIDGATEQEKKDFILGLLHHAARGILGAAHGVLHLAGHIIGDEKAASDYYVHHLHEHHHFHHYGGYGGHVFRYGYYGDYEQPDFLLGLAAHAIRGTLGVAHHAVNFVGHVLGDEQEKKDDDFLLGLIHHAARGILNVGHHALNLVGHIVGDEQEPKEDETDFLMICPPHIRRPINPSGCIPPVRTHQPFLGDDKSADDFLMVCPPHIRRPLYPTGCIPPVHTIQQFLGDDKSADDMIIRCLLHPPRRNLLHRIKFATPFHLVHGDEKEE